MSAIILDGQLKSALATVRSLGRRGVTVCVGATRGTAISLASKYVSEKFIYPSIYENQEAFKDALIIAAKKIGDRPVVYAFSDATYLTLFKYRDELENFVTLIFPDQTSVDIAFNKVATYMLAGTLGIPLIQTCVLETEDDIDVASSLEKFPLVVKTRRSVTWKDGVGFFGTATFVHSVEELVKTAKDIYRKIGEWPLVQAFVKGEEYGVEMLALQGDIHARAIHLRIRSLSPVGGASVLKKTVSAEGLPGRMEEYARLLVRELKWTGPIMVEFKVDSVTNEPLLMEINGRFWGSLPLEIAAGVDFPSLFYELAAGNNLPQGEVVAKSGVATRHFLGDVQHLLRVLFLGDVMRSYLYPSRIAAIGDFFSVSHTTRGDIWLWTDVLPSIMEYVDVVVKMISKKK